MQLKHAKLVLLLALLLLNGGSLRHASAQNGDGDNMPGQVLVVEVKDAAGRPLKRACVTYIPRNGEVQFRNADARGRVEFRDLTMGEGRVVAKVSGYAAQKKAVSVGAGVETVAFSLEPRN